VALASILLTLGFTYSEDFGPAPRANTLSRRTFVLHGDSPWILDLNLLSAFHAIRLHLNLLFILDLLLTIAPRYRLVNSLPDQIEVKEWVIAVLRQVR